MRTYTLFSFLLIFFLACSEPKTPKATSGESAGDSVSAAASTSLDLPDFTIEGNAINPKVIKAFTPWVSDNAPSIISIDLKVANNNNQFFAEHITEGKKHSFKDEDSSNFSYEYIGKTSSGLYVVKTLETSNETTFATASVLFFNCTKASTVVDGEVKEQLLLNLVKSYCLDTQSEMKVDIQGASVFIDTPCGKSGRVEVK